MSDATDIWAWVYADAERLTKEGGSKAAFREAARRRTVPRRPARLVQPSSP